MQADEMDNAQIAESTKGIGMPQAITSIMVATDLSARSDRAIERAFELAREHDAKLLIVHVVDDSLSESIQDQAVVAAEKDIDLCLNKVRQQGDPPTSIEVVIGSGHQEIVRQAKAVNADLVILGLHRDETRHRPVRGTTMERVVRYSPAPVLVVSERVNGPYRKSLVAVDFSIYSRFAVRGAMTIAPQAEISFLHAFVVPFAGFQQGIETKRAVKEGAEEGLQEFVKDELDALVGSIKLGAEPVSFGRALVRHGDVCSVVRTEAERLQPDLLVLGTHGRVGVAHMLLGSVAEHFLTMPPCDVLAVKAW